MIVLSTFQTLNSWITVFLDATLILFFSVPALYRWLYRPLRQNISERSRTEAALLESKEKYKTAVESSSDFIFLIDDKGTVLSVNEAAAGISGMKPLEMAGKNISELFPKETGRGYRRSLKKVLETGKSAVYESILPAGDKDLWISTSLSPVANGAGKVMAILGVSRDITERKQAEEALKVSVQKLMLHVEQTPLGVIEWNLDFEVTEWNPAAEAIFGFKKEVALGRHASFIVPDSAKEHVDEVWKSLLACKGGIRSTNENITKSGKTIFCEWYNTPLVDTEGVVVGVSSLVMDITERKQAEEALRESEEKYKRIVESSHDAIMLTRSDGIISYISPACKQVLGYDAVELVGKQPWIVHPDDLEKVKTIFNNAMQGESGFDFEYRINTRTNQTKWVSHSWSSILDNGKLQLIVSVVKDITERKQAEEALRESEEKYRGLFEESIAAVYLFDADKNFIDSNKAGLDLLGYTRDELLKLGISDVDADPVVVLPAHQELQEGGRLINYEHRLKRKDGTIITVLNNSRPLTDSEGNVVGTQSTLLNITERKRAEESNARLSRAIEQADETIVITDAEGAIQYVNPAFEKTTGYTAKEVVGENPRILKSGKHDDAFYKRMWKVLSSGKQWHGEITNKKKDGTFFTENATISPVFDSQGKIVNYVAAKNDITEQKDTQQNMRDLARIVENSLNEIYIFDAETFKFIQVNFGARENIGYTADELTELTPLDIKPEFTKELFIQLVEPLRNGAKERITFETVHLRKDGSLYDVEVHLQLSEYFDKPVFVAFILDITETKRLKELESRAQRLETAGTIAGQVAHDFNNLLAPMMAYPEFIREELPGNHPALQFLDQIEKASHKIAEINQDLLAMGRRGHYNLELLNLNTIVQHALSELKPYPEMLACETDLSEDLMCISGGGAQLHRVISNLLHNAKDAIQGIGKITVKTENYYVNDVSVAYSKVPKGEYVKLTISDTGCGIPDDIVQKIFDPFFTTKAADKKRGSGLGMSVVDAVIKDHNGHIDLSTKVGEGTSFYVYFPIARGLTGSQNSDKTCGGSEAILIVDDDSVQLEVSTQLLKRLGYEVNAVESGEKAIEFLRENPQDLVILDMVMPGGIDGTETYRRILDICPQQKAIILSGYSESERILEVQKLGAGAFVKKPVTKTVIAGAVRRELDRVGKSVTSPL